jgi:uncharacterized membrane protein required for colicin V production
MVIVTIVAALILIFSFIGGLTQGLVKSFFSVITFVIAVPVAGLYYQSAAGWLKVINNQAWQNLLGFFIIMAVASIILSLICFLPRKILDTVTHEMPGLRIIGGLLNLLGAIMGLIVLTCLISVFPVWEWLRLSFHDSGLISWLMAHFALFQSLLPELLRMPANSF